jgi:hypothetical protein
LIAVTEFHLNSEARFVTYACIRVLIALDAYNIGNCGHLALAVVDESRSACGEEFLGSIRANSFLVGAGRRVSRVLAVSLAIHVLCLLSRDEASVAYRIQEKSKFRILFHKNALL